jgi:enoyl-CoA hydratase/carnithine racemase
MDTVLIEDTQNVRTIQLNRPEKLNALNLAMYSELTRALLEGEKDPNVHVFLIQGTPDFFTTGHDLRDFIQGKHMSQTHPTVRFLYQLIKLKKPLIASVCGHAIGIGTTILMHCDMVFCGDNAHFQLPFTGFNLVPEAASTFWLPRLSGYQKAAQWLMLGEPFYAEEAKKFGLVNEIYLPEKTYEAALLTAQRLAKKPQKAVLATKALLKSPAIKAQEKSHLEKELRLFARYLKLTETRQRIQKILGDPLID